MEVISTHINADFDAMGSMIAAKKLYPEAILVFPGSQERTLREYFIKSTVYIYGFKRLRDIDVNEVTRLILVDTRQSSRIGKFVDILNKPGMEVHVYDHHPDSEEDIKADISVVRPVGSTVTLMTRLLRERGHSRHRGRSNHHESGHLRGYRLISPSTAPRPRISKPPRSCSVPGRTSTSSRTSLHRNSPPNRSPCLMNLSYRPKTIHSGDRRLHYLRIHRQVRGRLCRAGA